VTEIFKELHKGIDSLYLSFKGILKEGLIEDLEQLKTLAQSDDESEIAMARISIDDHHFMVMDKGRGRYAYVLSDGWYDIQISGSRGKVLPAIYVKFSSDLLNGVGVYNAVNQLRGLLKELLIGPAEDVVSRADLFVDFMTNTNLGSLDDELWIKKARGSNAYKENSAFTGISIGLGGDISARLYNKIVEIEKSRKDHLKAIWTKNGWREGQQVWRLEVQFKRNVLKQFSINTVSDLTECSNDLWRYCTNDWLRLALESKAKNKTRWKTHPVWIEIQQVKFGAGAYTGVCRDISRSKQPNLKALFLNGLGYMTDYAAYKDFDTVNLDVLASFIGDVGAFFREYSKRSQRYTGFEDYVRAKINLKKRKYNKPID